MEALEGVAGKIESAEKVVVRQGAVLDSCDEVVTQVQVLEVWELRECFR